MCHLCGKCKKAGLQFGDCMIVPKFIWVPGPNGGSLKKISETERKVRKIVAIIRSVVVR